VQNVGNGKGKLDRGKGFRIDVYRPQQKLGADHAQVERLVKGDAKIEGLLKMQRWYSLQHDLRLQDCLRVVVSGQSPFWGGNLMSRMASGLARGFGDLKTGRA
jgi:hypothetical protein